MVQGFFHSCLPDTHINSHSRQFPSPLGGSPTRPTTNFKHPGSSWPPETCEAAEVETWCCSGKGDWFVCRRAVIVLVCSWGFIGLWFMESVESVFASYRLV